jgi:hypothetical protein
MPNSTEFVDYDDATLNFVDKLYFEKFKAEEAYQKQLEAVLFNKPLPQPQSDRTRSRSVHRAESRSRYKEQKEQEYETAESNTETRQFDKYLSSEKPILSV